MRRTGAPSGMINMSESLNKLSACLWICLIPNLALGQTAPEHHVWQDNAHLNR
jgi:hypothetical protein